MSFISKDEGNGEEPYVKISTRLEVVPYRFFQTIKSPLKDMKGMLFRCFH